MKGTELEDAYLTPCAENTRQCIPFQSILHRFCFIKDEALRQEDSLLSLVAETESFLRSALVRAEEKIENEVREIEHLRTQIEKLRGMLFGIRSEKLRRQVEEAEALLKQQEQQSDRYNVRDIDLQVPRQLCQFRHHRFLPEHLLHREIHRLEPMESCCPYCGSDMAYLSEVSAVQLELVSSTLKVILSVRVKKACTGCDCIVEAPAPSRQYEILARQGVDLSRALLSN